MENFFGCKRPSSNWRLSVQICGESYCRTRRPEKSWNKFQLEHLYYEPALQTLGFPEYVTAVVPEEPNRDFTGVRALEARGDIEQAPELDNEPEPQRQEELQVIGCSFMMVMVNCSSGFLPQQMRIACKGDTVVSHPIKILEDELA